MLNQLRVLLRQYLRFILLLLLSGSCTQKQQASAPAPAPQASAALAPPPPGASGTSGASGKQGTGNPLYLAVEDAQVLLTADASEQDSTLVSGKKFPRVVLQLKKADFVQQMRCAASYQVKTLDGKIVKDALATLSRDDKKWAWTQAANQNQNCRLVGSYIVNPQAEDIAVSKGSYYYLLNPCIAAEHSASGNEECSYNLVFSSVVSVSEEYATDLRAKAQAVSQAEGELNAATENAIILAKKIAAHLSACEELLASDRNMLEFRRGIINISAITVGAGLGFAAGGPNLAVMGAMLIGQLGGMVVATKVFKFPVGIPNECVEPCALPAMAKEPSCANAEGKKTANDRYEGEFHVQELIKQLGELLGDSGLIAQKQQALQKVLGELCVADKDVETLNQALQKANKAGLDSNNPSTGS